MTAEPFVRQALPPTLVELLAGSVAARGDGPAVTLDDRTLTFRELDRRSARVCHALAATGIRPGSRVALLDRSSLEHFELLFGCAKSGAVYVPVNWRLAPREVGEVLADAEAELVVVGEEFVDSIDRLRAEGCLPRVREVVVLGKEDGPRSYDGWRDAHGEGTAVTPVASSDVVLQMYTSGTTGRPKGVLLTHANLCTAARLAAGWELDAPDAVSLVCMPLFHMSGTSWATLGLLYGAHLVLLRDADPSRVRAAVADHAVTHALLVPTLLQMVLGASARDDDLASLRLVLYGGSPIAPGLLSEAVARLGCAFVQLYGLTESTGLATVLPPEDHETAGERAALLRSVGRPADGVALRLVDPETGADVPTGAVGEVWLRSGQTMAGYWRQPEATAQALTPDGWLRTGDAAFADSAGYVFLVDRIKDMVITGGENVYPAEVERVLVEHPDVADVAVIGVPDATWGESVTAVVVPRPGAGPTSADIIEFARLHLAHYKCPRRVEFVDVLPRNPTGKVLKHELRRRLASPS